MLAYTSRTGIVAGLLILFLFAGAPHTVRACTGDAPPDPNEAVLIVEGWVERAALRPDLPSGFPALPTKGSGGGDPYVPVEITLRVERVLKGDAPSPFTFVEAGSVRREPLPDGSRRYGDNNCFAILNADPTGQYALLVLFRRDDGRLFALKGVGTAFGDGPDATRVQHVRHYVVGRLQPSALPNTGAGGAGEANVTVLAPHGMLTAGAVLLVTGVLLAGGQRLSRRTGGPPGASR